MGYAASFLSKSSRCTLNLTEMVIRTITFSCNDMLLLISGSEWFSARSHIVILILSRHTLLPPGLKSYGKLKIAADSTGLLKPF